MNINIYNFDIREGNIYRMIDIVNYDVPISSI